MNILEETKAPASESTTEESFNIAKVLVAVDLTHHSE